MLKNLIEFNKFPLFLALLIQITEFLFKLSGNMNPVHLETGSFLSWVSTNGKVLHITFIFLIAVFAFCILIRKNLFFFSAISLCSVLAVSWFFNSWVLFFLYPILIRHKKVSKINISQQVKSEQELFEDGFFPIVISGMLAFSALLLIFQMEFFIFEWKYTLFAFGVNNLFSVFYLSLFIILFLIVFSISIFFKGSPNLTAKVSAMGLMSLVFTFLYFFLSLEIPQDLFSSGTKDIILLTTGILTSGLFLFWGEIKYDHSFSELLYSILSPIIQRGYWGKLFLGYIGIKTLFWGFGTSDEALIVLLKNSVEIGYYFFIGWFALGGGFQVIKPIIEKRGMNKYVILILMYVSDWLLSNSIK